MSNLKLDIIYHKSASDFEMEFNLSGCCRMRIFKDKVDSNKGLVNTLAQDVARSKIILVVTDITGDGSGVPVISKAVGLPLVAPDKDEYRIKTTEPVYIPEGAVPLVTKSGIYGGCIIECGPQSIIIVSSVRSLRHEIMKAYVHNYVFDIGQILAYQERMGQSGHSAMPPMVRKPLTETPSVDVSPSAEAENNAENVPDEPEIPSNKEEPGTDGSEDGGEIYIDIGSAPDTVSQIGEPEKPRKRSKRKSRGSNVLLLIIVILLLIGFGILAYFFVYLPLIGEPGVFSDGTDNIITDFFNSFLE